MMLGKKKLPTILYVQNHPSQPVLGGVGNDAGRFYPCCSRPFHNSNGDSVPVILVAEHKELARLATASVLEQEAGKIQDGADPAAIVIRDGLLARARDIRAKKSLAVVPEPDEPKPE